MTPKIGFDISDKVSNVFADLSFKTIEHYQHKHPGINAKILSKK